MWYQRFISNFKGCRHFSHRASTIYALSSGHGKCGVAVIRVSGTDTYKAILKMTDVKELPKPRMAILKHIQDPITSEKLDKGLILWFPGPRSFTGEDSCEFQVHGGPAVVSSVLSALGKIENFRPAEAGEFTKRAFFNGKLDLTEIEGLGDLIHAETEMQRKQALLQMEGTLSKLYSSWRDILLQNVAHVEAYIDFSEDDNIDDNILYASNEVLLKLRKDIENHLADGRKGERLRDGVKTTIVGEPNAGKSSLFNALCRRPAAIVTPIAGTTRDLIEIHINVNGYPLVLTDTAGLRKETSDFIEKEGISRAHNSIKSSDLLLIVVDSTSIPNFTKTMNVKKELNDFLISHIHHLNLSGLKYGEMKIPMDASDLNNTQHCFFILNKTDLLGHEQKLTLKSAEGGNIICISCVTEDGFSSFLELLSAHLKQLCGCPSAENPTLTQLRHRHHLSMCCQYLNEYFSITDEADLPVAAHKLRKSLKHLGKITGKVGSEEILDVIFKDFCIVPAKCFSSSVKSEPEFSSEVSVYFQFNENFKDPQKIFAFKRDMRIFEDFVTPAEEQSLFNEIEPVVKRLRYENHHWDDAIKGYRETEKLHWNELNSKILNRIKELAFKEGTEPLKHVHVLDLKATGIIKPHVDSVKFCGDTIAGLSLLSDALMRLRLNEKKDEFVDILLKRRSLYIMTGVARYDYTHEILNEANFFDKIVVKTRRISVICRNQP